MFSSLAILSLALSAIPSALGHGIVSDVQVEGGADFKGSLLNGAPIDSAIRLITDASPVKGANNPAMNCGPNAAPAKLVAKVKAGDVLDILWTAANGDNWPHNTGPIINYLASCGEQSCATFDSTTAKWFKIEETLRDQSGQWVQAQQMQRQPTPAKIPANIAPGNYLMRTEIVALHLANQPGGAEFYPACIQLEISGTGTGRPTAAELVSFPGAYTDNDPGIFTQDAFNPQAKYVAPGPPIAAFISGGASGAAPANTGSNSGKGGNASGSGAAAGATKTASSSAANPTGASGAATDDDDEEPAPGECKLVKRRRSTVQKRSPKAEHASNVETYMPRHISRVMRSLKVRSLASSGMH